MGHPFELPDLSFATPLRDPRGLVCSTRSRAAIEHVEAALDAMLSYFGDPLARLDAAAAADPTWAHPLVLKASLLLTLAERTPAVQAHRLLGALPAGAATDRERSHEAAARLAAHGHWDAACERWEEILVRWPYDIAALLFAHLFDFYRGDALNLRRRPQRALARWSRSAPLYGYVLGMQAFGLEECGHHAEAEQVGLAALECNRRDPWAIHAVAHVHEMQGRYAEGRRWLASRHDDWAVENGFAFHNRFHQALFDLEALDTAAATAVFDQSLASATDMALQKVDGTAVLWRLRLLGADVGDRLARLRERWSPSDHAAGFYAFNDVHALLAHVADPDSAELQKARAALHEALAGAATCGAAANRRMSSEVGVPLALGLLAYAEARWDDCTEALWRVRDRTHGFGGSHAQRDLFHWTLLDAAIRARRRDLAEHLLGERLPHKSDTPLTGWWTGRVRALA